MRVIKSVSLIGLGVLLGIAGSVTASRVEVQAGAGIQRAPEIQQIHPGQAAGKIITSDDIGFQIVGTQSGRVTGTLMIRVDGRWMPASSPTGLSLVPAR